MDEQTSTPDVQESHEREYHDRLCGVLVEGATIALRHVFNGIHPPITLADKLNKHDVKLRLKRLVNMKILDEKNWKAIYPKSKKNINSDNYNLCVLYVLLRSICHLTTPYPHGWEAPPQTGDTAIAAHIVRLAQYRKLLLNSDALTAEECAENLSSLCDILVDLGGSVIKAKLDTILSQPLDDEKTELYLDRLSRWQEIAESLNTLEASHNVDYATRSSRSSTALPRLQRGGTQMSELSPTPQEATTFSSHHHDLSNEEKAVLVKHQKAIIETVRSEMVVAKLVKASVLTHEEKNTVNLGTRNTDRMKNLLQILATKRAHALDVFCEALKFKHPALHETLIKARLLAAQRPDEVTECRDDLKSNYTEKYSKYTPVHWHPECKVDLTKFYTPSYITDFRGRSMKPTGLLTFPGKQTLVEGASGVGKSALAAYLAYLWSKGDILKDIRLLFLIDLSQINQEYCSLEEIIISQCISPHLHKTAGQMVSLLNSHQAEVLFILDGYDKYKGLDDDAIADLLTKRLYDKSSVLLLGAGPYNNDPIRKSFDSHYHILGLGPGMEAELVTKYSKLTASPQQYYNPLLARIAIDEHSILQSLCLRPLYCLFMCLLCEVGVGLNFTTLTELLCLTLEALQLNYSRPEHLVTNPSRPVILKIVNVKYKQVKAGEIIANLCKRALTSVIGGDLLIPAGDVQLGSSIHEDEIQLSSHGLGLTLIPPLGLKEEVTCFHNSVIHDFMAAYGLSHLPDDKEIQNLEIILSKPDSGRIITFYCGLTKRDDQIHKILNKLTIINRERQKTTLSSSSHDGPEQQRAGSLYHETTLMAESVGRVRDAALSLECITECKGREDIVDQIVSSLPNVMFVKSRDVMSNGAIRGLAYVVSYNLRPSVTKLALHLDHFSNYKIYDYMVLAAGIQQSKHLKNLKLSWTDANLLALSLANIFGDNTSINSVTCIDRGKASQKITAEAWADFQRASANMKTVIHFNFYQCHNTQAVSCVLRHLPFTITALNLTGCLIDSVATQELAKRIESSGIQTLNLSLTSWYQMDFVYLCNGIRLSRTIKYLILMHLNLEGIVPALAEAIKFNKSLEYLDLQHSILTDDMCSCLSQALVINDSLTEINLTGSNISIHSEIMLKSYKQRKTKLTGLPKRKHKEMQQALETFSHKLPLIQKH